MHSSNIIFFLNWNYWLYRLTTSVERYQISSCYCYCSSSTYNAAYDTVCKLNPDSEAGNNFIFMWGIYCVCVWACNVTQYHSNVNNKVVANLTNRIEFTYCMPLKYAITFMMASKGLKYIVSRSFSKCSRSILNYKQNRITLLAWCDYYLTRFKLLKYYEINQAAS